MIMVRVMKEKRDVTVLLALIGFSTLEDAKTAIVRHLKEDCAEGDGGRVETVLETANGIGVETDLCGFGISNDDIEQAIAKDGREHVC